METRANRHDLSPYHLLLQFLQHNRISRLRDKAESLERQLSHARLQQYSQPAILEAVRDRILNSLKAGEQSQLYKRVKAELDQLLPPN